MKGGSKPTGGDIVARTIAQLGEEGWEMVTSAGGPGNNHLYFKRPKP